jgi:hypothetical protein
MTANNLIRACALVAPLVLATAPAAEPLRHDLFARPVLSGPAPSAPTGGAPAAVRQAPPPQQLLALIVAGKDSMANVGGSIIKVGEQTAGLRLMTVREGAAVFLRKDQVVVLTLRAPRPTAADGGGG